MKFPLNRLVFLSFFSFAVLSLFLLSGCEKEDVAEDNGEENTTIEESTGEETVTPETTDTDESTVIEPALDGDEYDPAEESANFDVAMESLDVSKCDNIENETAKESCISNVAIEAAKTSTDPAICDVVTNETAKATCLEKLGSAIEPAVMIETPTEDTEEE